MELLDIYERPSSFIRTRRRRIDFLDDCGSCRETNIATATKWIASNKESLSIHKADMSPLKVLYRVIGRAKRFCYERCCMNTLIGSGRILLPTFTAGKYRILTASPMITRASACVASIETYACWGFLPYSPRPYPHRVPALVSEHSSRPCARYHAR